VYILLILKGEYITDFTICLLFYDKSSLEIVL
jgi:hypothetical protein